MRRSLSLVGGLALGIALSQFPEYAQQYTQRLGGAVDELRAVTVDFDSAATSSGLTHDQALARYAQSSDTFLAGRGTSMSGTFARYEMLKSTLQQIRQADPWERLRLLPSYFDSDVGQHTLDDFQPAVPVTAEGLSYGALGLLLGYLVVSALYSLVMLPFRWQPRRRPKRI